MDVIASLSEFIQTVSLKKNVYFRGHSDLKYKLEPSIYRKHGKSLLAKLEHELVREAISQNVKDFSGHVSNFEKLTLMQHYGFPTRLLDITENPLVALYFAACSKEKKDGCVSFVTIPKTLIKHYDSDVVSILSAFSYIEPHKFEKLEQELEANIESSDLDTLKKRVEKNKNKKVIQTFDHFFNKNASLIQKNECTKILNDTQLIDYLAYEVQKEKPHFRKIINPIHFQNSIVCVKPRLNNERIVAQQGAFLLFGIRDGDKLVSPCLEDSDIEVESIKIPKEHKSKIQEELEKIGVTEQRLFPEIENSAKYITRKLKRRL